MAKAKHLLVLLIVSLLIILPVVTPYAQAQDDCGYSDCTDVSNFDSDLDGWALERTSGATLEWLASKTFGMLWWTSSADGVMKSSGDGRVQKELYMQPGRYRILFRAGADKFWNGWFFEDPYVVFKGQYGNTQYALPGITLHQTFEDFTTGIFEIDNPGPVMIEAVAFQPATMYFDYIWVVRDDTAGTPTPWATGGPPTKTPLAGTPTPVPTQATPIATPTGQYCVNAPTPTPGPGQFATPTATATAGPSPTPAPNMSWSYLDTFSQALLDWTVFGNNVYMTNNANHTSSNTQDLARSAFIGYNPTIALTTTDTFTSAIAFEVSGGFTLPFYVDGWAMGDSLPIGETAYVELWARDEPEGLWFKIGEEQISPQHWYTFHLTVDEMAGGSGTVSAIAFLGRRSDDPGVGGIFLDDVYLYGDLENARRCDGTYPTGTTILSSPVGRSDEVPGDKDGWTYDWPANKPCPPDIKVPNNFWGPLLAQVTVFLDNVYAMAPYHEPSSLTTMVQNFIGSPIAIYFGVAATFFNLRIPLLALGIVLVLNIGIMVRGVWMIIKESIPFL